LVQKVPKLKTLALRTSKKVDHEEHKKVWQMIHSLEYQQTLGQLLLDAWPSTLKSVVIAETLDLSPTTHGWNTPAYDLSVFLDVSNVPRERMEHKMPTKATFYDVPFEHSNETLEENLEQNERRRSLWTPSQPIPSQNRWSTTAFGSSKFFEKKDLDDCFSFF
jgi:hypothetical protein